MGDEIRKLKGAPMWCYLSIMGISFLIFGLSIILPSGPIHDIILNIALGMFSSALVAFLLDFSNTTRQLINDKTTYFYLTMGLKQKIEELLLFRVQYYPSENKEDVEYIKWIHKLTIKYMFNDERTSIISEKELFISCFKQLLEAAMELEKYSPLLSDNSYMPDTFFISLEELIQVLKGIVSLKMDNEKNEYYHTSLMEECFMLIVHLFPEYKDAFLEKWDSDKVVNEYLHLKKLFSF